MKGWQGVAFLIFPYIGFGGIVVAADKPVSINNTNHITVNPVITTSNSASDSALVLLMYQMMQKMGGQAQQQIVTSSFAATDYIQKNWGKLGIGCCIASYLACLGMVVSENKYIQRSDIWGFWRTDLSDDELMSLPADSLQQSLILAIQERYFNPNEPVNFVQPLIRFCLDIDLEIARIDRYLFIVTALLRRPFCFVFPVSKENKKRARRALRRARFIKKSFLSWAAQYNFYASARRVKNTTGNND